MNPITLLRRLLAPVKHAADRRIAEYKARRRRRRLTVRDFSPISNNCSGGFLCQWFALPYTTPTAGLEISSADFPKLMADPRHYLTTKPVFYDDPNQAPGRREFTQKDIWGQYPVACIDDIDVFFLHYPTREKALNAWQRRCARVNYDRIVFLFAERQGTTDAEREAILKAARGKNLVYLSKRVDRRELMKEPGYEGLHYGYHPELNLPPREGQWFKPEIGTLVDWPEYLKSCFPE